jgi:hypothetical protein
VHVVAMGCDVSRAAEVVYADGIELTGAAVGIGLSCGSATAPIAAAAPSRRWSTAEPRPERGGLDALALRGAAAVEHLPTGVTARDPDDATVQRAEQLPRSIAVDARGRRMLRHFGVAAGLRPDLAWRRTAGAGPMATSTGFPLPTRVTAGVRALLLVMRRRCRRC